MTGEYLTDFIPKEASWISNEFLPPIQDLIEQGYDPDDQNMLVELLMNQGLNDAANYLSDLPEAEWRDFADFTLREGVLKTALVSERLKQAFTRLLALVPEDISPEEAQTVIPSAIAEMESLTEEEQRQLQDMVVEKWPRLEMALEAARKTAIYDPGESVSMTDGYGQSREVMVMNWRKWTPKGNIYLVRDAGSGREVYMDESNQEVEPQMVAALLKAD